MRNIVLTIMFVLLCGCAGPRGDYEIGNWCTYVITGERGVLIDYRVRMVGLATLREYQAMFNANPKSATWIKSQQLLNCGETP